MRRKTGAFVCVVAITAATLSASAFRNARAETPQIAQIRSSGGENGTPPGEVLDEFTAHQGIEPDVAHRLQALYPKLKTSLKDGNGWLLYVEIFTDADNSKHPGRTEPVAILGQGATPDDAALNYFLINALPPPAPSGMLLDEKQSYLIWVSHQGDGIVFSKTPYPFYGVILDTGNRVATSALAAAKSGSDDHPGGTRDSSPKDGNSTAAASTDPALESLAETADRALQEQNAVHQALQAQLQDIERRTEIIEQRKREVAAQIAREKLRAQAGQPLFVDQTSLLDDQPPRVIFMPKPAPKITTVSSITPEIAPPIQENLTRGPVLFPQLAKVAPAAKPLAEEAGSGDQPESTDSLDRRPTWNPKPAYPQIAENAQIEGYVDFEFNISADGSVGNPHLVAEVPQGHGFAQAAREALLAWKFAPVSDDPASKQDTAFYRFRFKLTR